jgi:hypothetical protein
MQHAGNRAVVNRFIGIYRLGVVLLDDVINLSAVAGFFWANTTPKKPQTARKTTTNREARCELRTIVVFPSAQAKDSRAS